MRDALHQTVSLEFAQRHREHPPGNVGDGLDKVRETTGLLSQQDEHEQTPLIENALNDRGQNVAVAWLYAAFERFKFFVHVIPLEVLLVT
jgi:hypothetical protein